MDINTQTDMLTNDLCNIINRYKKEFDLNDQTIIGILEFVKYDLLATSVIEFDPDFLEDDDIDEDTQGL
jgi:hypothetical protein|tara:strand:+ start:1317 stop:1523 length:207 start_codon:yes stop_codon:yes gene_type:complete